MLQKFESTINIEYQRSAQFMMSNLLTLRTSYNLDSKWRDRESVGYQVSRSHSDLLILGDADGSILVTCSDDNRRGKSKSF
jgi:hypothetical protein